MPQQYKIGKFNTTVKHENGKTTVRLYQTDVISWDDQTITLNSGGWKTQTTKNRINQASNEYGLGIKVYQYLGVWYVKNDNSIGCNNRIVPFKDGLMLEWNPGSKMKVKNIPLGCLFVSDSQEVQAIDDYLGQVYPSSHCYFVDLKNGDYDQMYLIEGIIPYLEKECFKVR